MSNLSPALRHRARMLAERTAGAAEPLGVTTGNAYDLMLYKLADDRRRLKSIQSVERKIEVKTTLLPDYDRALVIAAYCMEHRFTLPETYSRDIPTMMLDEFAAAYLQGKLGDDPQHAVAVLGAVEAMTAASDAPDQARAKLHKAIGLATVAALDQQDATDIAPALLEQAGAAMAQLQRARALSESVGVKKDMERLERRIKRAADSS